MALDHRARQITTLVVACLGFFMVLLDASIVTVALPSIQHDLHAQLADLQWVVDAYTLPFAALLLTAGTLGDRFGRKRMFLLGLAVFTVGSLVCGLAPSLGWLIAGRVIQGAGGAALSPGSLSVLAAAFTNPRQRSQIIGVWSGVSGIALAAGPLVGGALIQVSGWQAIFYVNLPIGALAFILGVVMLAESRDPSARRLDIWGQTLAVATLALLTYALIEGQTDGWGSPLIVGLFAASALLLVTFLVVEARVAEPMLPLGLFRSASFAGANIAALVNGFALLGTVFFLSQYFQEVQRYTALQTGERTLPATVGIFITAPIAGWVTARVGPRLPVTLGALLAGAALLLMTGLAPATSYADIWWTLGLFGVGIGMMVTPITAAVLAATPANRAGLASSMVNTSRQLGSVLGIAVLGAVVERQEAGALAGSLTALHLPTALSETLARAIAAAGAGAAQLRLSVPLPISPLALRQLIGDAFTQALHPAFGAAGVALLFTAALALALLGRPRPRAASASAVEAEQPERLPSETTAQPV